MKKLKFLTLIIFLISITGCSFKNDSMEDIEILTSSYPIEYVVKSLYGDHSKVVSIYPKDNEMFEFEVTDVLLDQYEKSNLFIFNGLSDEKNYVKHMLDINKNLKIIDVTSNMSYDTTLEELWLDPNNLLTIANNIKKGFKEYIKSTYLTDEIEENYKNLKIELANIDGKYYSTVKNSTNLNIIVSDDAFLYLKKYGINVISLDKDTVTQKNINEAKALLENGTCNYIFIKYKEDNQTVKELTNNTLELYSMTNLNDIDTEKNSYVSLMNQNLENLKLELYK